MDVQLNFSWVQKKLSTQALSILYRTVAINTHPLTLSTGTWYNTFWRNQLIMIINDYLARGVSTGVPLTITASSLSATTNEQTHNMTQRLENMKTIWTNASTPSIECARSSDVQKYSKKTYSRGDYNTINFLLVKLFSST